MFFKEKNKTRESNDSELEKCKNDLESKIQQSLEEIEIVRKDENMRREEIDSIKEEIIDGIKQDNIDFYNKMKNREQLVDEKLNDSEKEISEALKQGNLDKVKDALSKLL